jgi:hypothetical protein
MPTEIKVCPSCGSAEIEVAVNKVHCKACDVTYKITPEGAKVDNLDPLDQDRKRISALEQEVQGLKAGAAHGPQSEEAEDEPLENQAGGFSIDNDDKPEGD